MRQNKSNFLIYAIMAVPIAILMYYLAAGWRSGIVLSDYIVNMNEVMNNPFVNYFNAYTIKFILAGWLVLGLYAAYMITSSQKFMNGIEYGSSGWANIKQINKRLSDPDKRNNKILSNQTRLSIDGHRTQMNNNVLYIGGSGAGKSLFGVTPNLHQLNTSFIVTDPKGELLRRNAKYLLKNGYAVKVVNLVDMKKSDCYNPFTYVRKEEDVIKLITNLIANTTPSEGHAGDPFWEKAEGLFLQSLFFYVWMECPPAQRNFNSLLDLMAKAKVLDDEESELDILIDELEEKSELHGEHPAVKQYRKSMSGAADTIRSIVISAHARLEFFETKGIKRILSRDDMDIASIGIGKSGDGETKTALFCVIPDVDKSYNFVIGMLYTQIFQELYYQADFNFGGSLPIPVAFWLDEFSNVALPEDFLSELSTMRSRNISANVIIQNLAQIKAKFKDGKWEDIPGNCDVLVYLGGNELSTHEYISKRLGKITIHKKSNGLTRGRNGSSSQNVDVIQRDLMTLDEVGRLSRRKCIVFLKGELPILDLKYQTFKSVAFKLATSYKQYDHNNGVKFDKKGNIIEEKNMKPAIEILNAASLAYYEEKSESEENVYIEEMSFAEFAKMYSKDEELRKLDLSGIDFQSNLAADAESMQVDADYNRNPNKKKNRKAGSVEEALLTSEFTTEQMMKITNALQQGVTEEQIMSFIYETDVNKMEAMINAFVTINALQNS